MLHTAPAALNSLVRLPDTGGGVTFGERRTRVPRGSARALTGPEPVALGLTRLPPLTLADTLVTITAGIGVPVAQVEFNVMIAPSGMLSAIRTPAARKAGHQAERRWERPAPGRLRRALETVA